MQSLNIHVTLLFLVLTTSLSLGSCPADSLRSLPDSIKAARFIDEIDPSSIGESCLVQIAGSLTRAHGSRSAGAVLRLIGKWIDRNSFSLALLYRLTESQSTAAYPGLPRGVLSLWEKKNGAIRPAIAGEEARGGFARADSLFEAFDRGTILSAADLMQWAHFREIVYGYGPPAVLYGRALGADPGKADLVYWKLSVWLENAPPDSLAFALRIFEKSALRVPKLDTIGLLDRLAELYGRHGRYDAEAEVLLSVPETRSHFSKLLCDVAGRLVSRRLYANAIAPAVAAYACGENQVKTAAAGIACRAYEGLQMPDSALVWLSRAGSSAESRIETITLYQETGKLAQTAALIQGLPPTFARDTLGLRQRLFEGDTAGAAEAVGKGVAWAQRPDETMLWSARTLLFRGDIDRLSRLWDSTSPDPSWKSAQEILRDRLIVHQLGSSNNELAAWSRIEYNLFIGRPEIAEDQLSRVQGEGGIPLLLRIVEDQLGRGRNATAEALFEKEGDTVDSPEYLYLRAETLLRIGAEGNRERAQSLLRRIIRNYPGDVFSEKARVLLAAGIPGK